MSSYLITGVARGLGFEFIRQLSEDPNNTVIGIVRNKSATEKRVAEEIKRENIHILEADMTDFDALKRAVERTAEITGGSLDYVISNAAIMSTWSGLDNFGTLWRESPARLEDDMLAHFRTNVIGPVHLFNLTAPLVLRGRARKVVALTTGLADLDLTAGFDLDKGPSYSVSKAALNLTVAKFSAEYREQGVLFVAISPGFVDTSLPGTEMDPETARKAGIMAAKFNQYAPHFTAAMTPEASVKAVLGVINKASIENGDAGAFISHLGNKQWL